jgi:hypothetical protein
MTAARMIPDFTPGTCGSYIDTSSGTKVCNRAPHKDDEHCDSSQEFGIVGAGFRWWDECRECGTTERVNRGWCARCYVASKC